MDDPQTAETKAITYIPMIRGSAADNDGHLWGLFEGRFPMMGGVDVKGPNSIIHKRVLAPTDIVPTRSARGRYIYGGVINPHYGHFIINTLPKLWQFARGQIKPDDKILFHSYWEPQAWFKRPFIRDIFCALGVTPDRVEIFDQPTRIEQLSIPGTSLVEQQAVHQVFGALGKLIGRSVIGAAPLRRHDTPVYLSKSALKAGVGRIANETAIEAVLKLSGFDVVFPEQLKFADQVRLFSERSHIVSGTGSFLHTSLFAAAEAKITVFCTQQRPNSNFDLVDKVTGFRPTYVFCLGGELADDARFLRSVTVDDPEGIARELVKLQA